MIRLSIKPCLFLLILFTFQWLHYNITLFHNLNSNKQGQTFVDEISTLPLKQNRLEFVHITKTGGSAIEKLASQHKIRWGACHFSNNTMLDCFHNNHVPWRELYIGTAWHAPPKVINDLVPKDLNPYLGADLFAVVRNPYDRAISEYYCPFFGMDGSKNNDDPIVMNKWIQNMIQTLEDFPPNYYYKSPTTKKFPSKKHYLNQVEYIYDTDGFSKLIKHILHFENLSKEFNQLMEEYNLDLRLSNNKKKSGVNVSSKGKLTYRDLSDETIRCINKYAALDFELLGYVKVDTMNDNYSLEAIIK